MCQFVSWVEYEGEVYFLDDVKLNTKEGRKLLKPEFYNDILGHGAVRHYYKELGPHRTLPGDYKGKRGVDMECSDFSTPDNFPKPIVEAIKKGLFRNFDARPDILTARVRAEFEKGWKAIWKKYVKVEAIAWKKYLKIKRASHTERVRRAAFDNYLKVKGAAKKEYKKPRNNAFWDLATIKENRVEAWR